MARPVLFLAGRDPLAEVSGGHSAYVRAHARAAQQAGYDPHVLCVGRGPRHVPTPWGEVHRLGQGMAGDRQLLVMRIGPRLAAAAVRLARRLGGVARLHGFAVWGWSAVAAARQLRREGRTVRVVVSAYTRYDEEKRSLVRGATNPLVRAWHAAEVAWIRVAVTPFEREAFEGCDALLTNYEAVDDLLDVYDLAGHRHRVPYTSEVAWRQPGRRARAEAEAVLGRLADRRAPLVVCVSRHDPRKGVEVLVDALARLRREGVAFRACLVGGGELLAARRAQVRSLGLEDRVAVPGTVEDVIPFLRAATAYALPSRAEQSGSVALLEAMWAGLPAVVSACDGLVEDVEHERDALLVPPGDPAALAAALGRLLADEGLRRRLGHAARAAFDARFAPAHLATALTTHYQPIAKVPGEDAMGLAVGRAGRPPGGHA